VFDVDGTLKPRDGPVTETVASAVRRAIDSGTLLTIATGRTFQSARPYAIDLGISVPIICTGGALVREPSTGLVLHRESIPLAAALRVVEIARAVGLPVAAYFDDELYAEGVVPDSPFGGYIERTHGRLAEDLIAVLPGEPIHMAVVTDGDRTRPLVRELQASIGDVVNVTSGHPLLAEIDALGASKGTALRWLVEYLGVDRSSVLAVGDDWNDVAMLEQAGVSIAMSDSPPEVLAVADAVAPPASEDGAAWVIERYVLGAAGGSGSGSANL
jgi:Cof subfamily protein (haloacid dehalogenase superfamily)